MLGVYDVLLVGCEFVWVVFTVCKCGGFVYFRYMVVITRCLVWGCGVGCGGGCVGCLCFGLVWVVCLNVWFIDCLCFMAGLSVDCGFVVGCCCGGLACCDLFCFVCFVLCVLLLIVRFLGGL